MSLNAQQIDALNFHLGQLLEHDEPVAFVATLQRVAERKAYSASKAAQWASAVKWQSLADACAKVASELKAALRTQISSYPAS